MLSKLTKNTLADVLYFVLVKKQNKPRHRSDDGIIYAHDRCASIDCYHPRNATNTWVQCDDCDKWFHLKCAGLSDKAARSSETTFYCGCS